MSEHQDHHHEAPKDEQALPHHPPYANNNHHEINNYPQAPSDDFQGSFNPFGLLSGPYDHLVNYQHAPQSLGLYPQQDLHTFADAQPASIQAPTGFYNPPTLGQSWVEEIHPSYTPIQAETFEWTLADSSSYGWLVDTPFTNQGAEAAVYENPPTMLPVNQYMPLEAVASESLAAHRAVSQMPRMPLQQALPPQPASAALKVRNEKLKNDITSLPHDKTSHSGHRPLRVSKTKKTEKVNNNVKQEACWRCKRYRKACIGQDICKECSTAGFRVWPSSIGCRRGAMEGFVERIMPSHSVGVLRDLRIGVSRTSNWRKALCPPDEVSSIPKGTSQSDRWDLLKLKVQSTMVFGADFSALVDILANYEKARNTEIPIWTQSIILLSSTCDFYHFFVESSNTKVQLPNLINATIRFRKSLLRSWDMFLKLCLSGRREDWFPAFLTVLLGICSMVILTDAVPSMPGPTRKAIWSDIESMIKDLRVRQHMMTLDLLRIGAKGNNPLKLDCWMVEEEIDSEGRRALKRHPKGMALLGHDNAAFDSFTALRLWHSGNKAAMLQGKDMWDSVPYTLTQTRGIASLSRVFEF